MSQEFDDTEGTTFFGTQTSELLLRHGVSHQVVDHLETIGVDNESALSALTDLGLWQGQPDLAKIPLGDKLKIITAAKEAEQGLKKATHVQGIPGMPPHTSLETLELKSACLLRLRQ